MNISVSFPFDSDDQHSLALVGWKEARGQGGYGLQAVMCVACNRVGTPGFPKTLHDVIFEKNAFSSMSRPADPQFNLEPQPDDLTWRGAVTIAGQILAGVLADPTKGAKYYANLKNVDPHGWFARNIVARPDIHPETAVILDHTFYA